jgi:hypothetical protein
VERCCKHTSKTLIELGDLDEFLQTVRPGAKVESVEVMAVENFEIETAYRVDIKSKKLISIDKSKVSGAGGAFVQSFEGDPASVKTVILHQ